jgi:hypothetical protein
MASIQLTIKELLLLAKGTIPDLGGTLVIAALIYFSMSFARVGNSKKGMAFAALASYAVATAIHLGNVEWAGYVILAIVLIAKIAYAPIRSPGVEELIAKIRGELASVPPPSSQSILALTTPAAQASSTVAVSAPAAIAPPPPPVISVQAASACAHCGGILGPNYCQKCGKPKGEGAKKGSDIDLILDF